MEIKLARTNINELIEYVYDILKFDADKKRINLSFENSLPVQDAFTFTDQEKLFSILTNLVQDAIKYTNNGSVEFGYHKMEDCFKFYVKDTGIGISSDRLEAIFERFIQADIYDIQARQGAGLGLSISKAFVEMLKGKIWVESEPGIGSTFQFTLPLHTA